MKRTLLILLTLTLAGCEDSKTRAAREALTGSLTGTTSLSFRYVFTSGLREEYTLTFLTDKKETIGVQLAREDPQSGGDAKYQEFWINVEPQESFLLKPGSKVEERLLELLRTCTLAPLEKPDLVGNPSKERLEWLMLHLRDRTLRWTALP